MATGKTLEATKQNFRVVSKPIVIVDDFVVRFEEINDDIVKGSVVDIAPAGRFRSGVESASFKFVRTRLVEFRCKWPKAVVVN